MEVPVRCEVPKTSNKNWPGEIHLRTSSLHTSQYVQNDQMSAGENFRKERG